MQNEIKYFSMFTGIEGFGKGFQNASEGFKCIGISETDKYCNQVLRYRYPNIKNYGDATKINPRELPDFDLLCGGFPCQTFSIAGKRRGFEDIRGTMFFQIARILKIKRPKIILLENVKGLLNHNKGETFKVILQTLDELGYAVQWMVLNSKFFGVPQNRERVFIIGSLRGEPRPEILPFRRINKEDNELCKFEEISHTIHSRIAADSNGTYIESRKSPQTILDANQAQRVYSTEGTSVTLKGNGGGQGAKTGLYCIGSTQKNSGVMKNCSTCLGEAMGKGGGHIPMINLQNTKIRRLTPTECCRLQAFPDDWNKYGIDEKGNKVKISDSQRYKQMGNAVTCSVIQAIAEKLIK